MKGRSAMLCLTLAIISCTFNTVTAVLPQCQQKYYCDCEEAFDKGEVCSGVYTIKPDNLPPFNVYCDMDSPGGGWVVFQRRMDGTEDFYRNWTDYVKGFGDLNGEFWLGLSKIHRLSKRADTTLRIDLEDFDGQQRYANYTTFKVLDSSTNYTLDVGGYSGNAGDSMTVFPASNGMQFTTKDRHNDIWRVNCAILAKGAWWYSSCYRSSLNSPYLSGAHTQYGASINWSTFRGYYYSLKITEMKLK